MHIRCRGFSIGLDSSDGDISFVSHAHSDHTGGLKNKERILASPETIDLAGFDHSQNWKPDTENRTLAAECRVPDAGCWKLLAAGHILGARQLLVEGDGESIVYTGDISLKPNIFGWKAEIPQCDRLIMEATYGDPAYRFSEPQEVYSQLSRWVAENDSCNLIIGSYDLGKTQELIRILNESSVAPIVTEKAERFCKIYEHHGVKLDRAVVGSEEAEEMMSRRFVAIVSMSKAKRYFAHRLGQAFERKTLCAVATGWALHYRFNTDAAFPLSDHADFDDLVYYVEQSGAKDVEFFCGDGSKVLAAARGELLNL